ncbi:S1/P1 nuclease [Sphingomonas sp. IC081]|uniref:S1/P1 nuclease n=1 Tax=Sphingomonas sp. IC081 TaxID=304378 RepID=UPI001158F821|nr:S1/P1 nuclease [Sphingomonas sp. IC081]QDK34733.1 endonuclease [Sphingomonas sp. IC081]
MKKTMTTLAAMAGLAAATLATPAMAWGALGHRTVAAIALENVKPGTRAQIAALLRHQGELDTPECSARTLQDAATWPDCIKNKDERWRFAFTSSWHYHDQPVCGLFDLKTECRDGNCVTAQIDRNERLLADRKLATALRLEALIFVTHFVGDVHQPLHVGENHDQGGNKVETGYGEATGFNLHYVWDGLLAERAITAANPPLVRRYSAEEKARLATGKTEDWARESWEISRDVIYPAAYGGTLPCDLKGGDVKDAKATWSEAAIEAAVPIVDKRIQQAGLRLARMLDEALG